MNHGTRRNSPAGVADKIKAENAAKGIAELPENRNYDAVRANVLATKKQRRAQAAQRRRRDAELKARGIDPERYTSPEMLELDAEASAKLGVPSLREQLGKGAADMQGKCTSAIPARSKSSERESR